MPKPEPYRRAGGQTTWRVRFRHHGRQTSRTFYTERKARIFCRDIDDRGVDYAVRLLDEETETTPTLDELVAPFLEWKARRVRSDRTTADYRREWDRWIAPTFGHQQAGRVTPDDVQAWVESMLAASAPKSILDRHALLHAVYKWAARTHHLTNDPCADTDLPRRRKGAPKGLRPAEFDALYRAIRQGDSAAGDLTLFLVASGWRWSEATALTTYDVEDDGARLWVTMTQVIRRNAAGQHVPVADGKADASLRRIELDPDAAAMVRRRVAAARPGGLVFTTSVSPQNGLGGSQWHYSNFLDRHWNPAVKAANLGRRPTPHWLRHTHVAWAVMAGAPLPELQARIGHASIQTTIGVYGRMITDVQQDTLERLAAMRRSGEAPAPALGESAASPPAAAGGTGAP